MFLCPQATSRRIPSEMDRVLRVACSGLECLCSLHDLLALAQWPCAATDVAAAARQADGSGAQRHARIKRRKTDTTPQKPTPTKHRENKIVRGYVGLIVGDSMPSLSGNGARAKCIECEGHLLRFLQGSQRHGMMCRVVVVAMVMRHMHISSATGCGSPALSHALTTNTRIAVRKSFPPFPLPLGSACAPHAYRVPRALRGLDAAHD